MPKSALFALRWSETEQHYILYERQQPVLQADIVSWFAWLTTHTAFAFHGKRSHFNLLKETRKNKGEGYWYAYQRQGRRTSKRYVGRSAELTTARLEEIERELPGMASTSPLLAPKFHLPRLPSALVLRERLLALLDRGMGCRLTLLSAPAGSGKTTLVSQWITARRTQPYFPSLAWLALENSDNDPMRFWRYLMTACDAFPASPGQTALAQLATMPQAPFEAVSLEFLETIITVFLNDLTHSLNSGMLILEDYHLITSPHIHKTMAFFLDHLPPLLHVIIMTRNDPPLPLSRLRVQGELCEITASDLRFSPTELAAFLQPLAPALCSPVTVQRLETALAGWAAGLRLFALTLQRMQKPEEIERYLEDFIQKQLPFQAYIVDEVLNAQPAHLQAFLLYTCCIPGRLTASLCDAITGKRNSAALLETIARAGLFLERLDGPGQWYRYHALFVEVIYAEARRRLDPERLRTVSLLACDWYEQQGMFAEAVETALRSEEMIRAAETIERQLALKDFDATQEFHTLRRWLELLPLDVIHDRPLLCLYYAMVLPLSFMPATPPADVLDQVEELLRLAEECWRGEGNMPRLGNICALRAPYALWRGKPEQAAANARQALLWLPSEALRERGICLNILAGDQLRNGQLFQARETLQEALALWSTIRHPHGARSHLLLLALTHFGQGELHLAHECYCRALREAREVGDTEDIIPALLGLARLSYEWNELEAAEQAVQEAYALGEQMQSLDVLTQAAIVQARILHVRGQNSQARQRLSSLRSRLFIRPDLSHEALLCQARLLLADGDYATARRYLESATPAGKNFSSSLQEQEALLRAHLLLQWGEAHLAADLLESLRRAAQEAGRGYMLLEIQLLLARAQNAQRLIQDARQTLQTVLTFAHTEGYLRLFLDDGEELFRLLRSLQPHLQEQPLLHYLQKLLRVSDINQNRADNVDSVGVLPLSPQEQHVLRLLIAELSYPEIARELVVSVNTIKTQVASIYRKLDVHNRREARAVVSRLQLFSRTNGKSRL